MATTTNIARAGQVYYRVVCRCDGARLVLEHFREGWHCTCRKEPTWTHRVTLGPGGFLPPPEEWEELAA